MDFKEKGLYLEYHRVKTNTNIQKFIMKEYKICNYETYRKVVDGTCNVESIYADLYKENGILFNKDKNLDEKIHLMAKQMKNALNYLKVLSIKKELEVFIETFERDYSFYPYLGILDFIKGFYSFHIENMKMDIEEINKYKDISDIFPYELKVCFYHLYYQIIYLQTLDVECINKAVQEIPESLHNEAIIQRIIISNHKYLGEMNKALEICDRFEKYCVDTNNNTMLLWIYENNHGIYEYLNIKDKAMYYLQKLNNAVKDENIDDFGKEHALYYLGMHYFNQHEFENAKSFFDVLLKKDPIGNRNLILPYLHISSNLDKENLKELLDIFSSIDEKAKIESIYYLKKYNKISKNKLKKYLLEKVFVILNKNNVFDYHIFLEELYQLGYVDECKNIIAEYKAANRQLKEKWLSFLK